MATTYERLLERYLTGKVPWDDKLPPPEVEAFLEGRASGRALDLGTGYGRAAIYMAQRGWQVDAVDFMEVALAEAKRRADAADVAINFHFGQVTDLGFLTGPYDFALDVGCLHSLDEAGLRACHNHLVRLLRPGATFLSFVHLRNPDEAETDRPHGVDEALWLAVFTEELTLERVERGITQVEDKPPWPSAWFWFRR